MSGVFSVSKVLFTAVNFISSRHQTRRGGGPFSARPNLPRYRGRQRGDRENEQGGREGDKGEGIWGREKDEGRGGESEET